MKLRFLRLKGNKLMKLNRTGVLLLNAAKVNFILSRNFWIMLNFQPILCHFSTLGTGAGLLSFDFLQLVNATNNFSQENKIGEGGSGQVYQGLLQGRLVAIKKCFEESCPERSSDFANEIRFIPMLQHRNIVKLLGYCTEGKEKILVYEFMPKKSLDKFIFDGTNGESLNWDTLFHIIEGIAQGVCIFTCTQG